MSLPTSELAYSQCFEVMDRALEDQVGIRMRMDSLAFAMNFRMRCHQARKLNRERNAKIYVDPEHPMHGRSAYDVLIIRDPKQATDGVVYLVIERSDVGIDESAIENLSEAVPVEFQSIERIETPRAKLLEEPKVQEVRRR